MSSVLRCISEVAQLLKNANSGDLEAANRVFAIIYPELKRIAQKKMQDEKGYRTLQATALANEAWIKLLGNNRPVNFQSRADFVLAATNAMRQVLVDSSRSRNAAKRRGNIPHVPLKSNNAILAPADDQILCLEEALSKFEESYPVKANVVLLRYFGGMTTAETAACLEISTATVERYWAFARAWLKNFIQNKDA